MKDINWIRKEMYLGYIYVKPHSKKGMNWFQKLLDWNNIETKGGWIKCPLCNRK